MAVNATVVRALKLIYTQQQLEAKRAEVAAEVMAGVQVTQVTFEGGGASGQRSMTPQELLELIQTVIDWHENADLAGQPNSAFVDLSQRAWGT